MSAILVTGLALVGTWIQFVLSVQQVDGFEREAFRVIDDWRREVPVASFGVVCDCRRVIRFGL